jgi:hypothetical protein
MHKIKEITPESKQAEACIQKGQKVTVLDQRGRFSSVQRSIEKEDIEPTDLRRGGMFKPFLRKATL